MDTSELPARLDELTKKMYDVANEACEYVEPIVYATAQEKLNVHLKLYTVLKFFKEVGAELSKMAEKNMPVVAERAEKRMTQDDLEQVRFGGLIFSPDKRNFINVNAGNKPTVMQWLKSHELGREIVKEDYHPKTFEKFITENFINKGETPPPTISVFQQPVLKVTKART